jgi:DNA polymerase III subunit delta
VGRVRLRDPKAIVAGPYTRPMASAPPEIKPVYLITGDDEAKVAIACGRFRARAEREGGPGALERFDSEGRRAPDAEALIGALSALSLTASRRYLLADGVQGWGKADTERVTAALGTLPPETTVALVARGKAPAALGKAVKAAGGELLNYAAPRERELPGRLVADARELGFALSADAARLLVARLGPRPLRLRTELERLALWAGEGGGVGVEDLESMIADTSEEAIWSLADALVEGDRAAALAIAEKLTAQGEALPRIIHSVAPRVRQAATAARELEQGRAPGEVAKGLSMHPYAAKMLVSKVKGRSPESIAASIEALADLEVWSRGGTDYTEPVALTLALREAV